MSVLVLGAGRSGTNMALEILSGHPFLKATIIPEDKRFFERQKTYPDNYLTKCDTCYVKDITELHGTIGRNPNLAIILTIRDPRDMLMSKLRRGVTEKEGGDCKQLADDATPEGAIKDMSHMDYVFDMICRSYPDRIMLVKMEDMILNTQKTVKDMCDFLGLDFYYEMLTFYKRMRNSKKKNRYKGIDKSQVEMWKKWETAYCGWLKEKYPALEMYFIKLKPYAEKYRY